MVDVPAPMTGTVLEVLCAVGDQISNAQEVLVLESMKMEIPVECPEAGRVAELVVEEGQHVEEGDILLKLEQ